MILSVFLAGLSVKHLIKFDEVRIAERLDKPPDLSLTFFEKVFLLVNLFC